MTRPRILVVDDEQPMLRSVVRILEEEYEVQGISSAREACVLAPLFQPTIAILDIRMPHMDGYELLNALKRIDPEIQVILMTGSVYNVDDQLIRAIREKAFYFINKPFDREVLRALVRRSIELRMLEDTNRRHVQRLESQLGEAKAFQSSMLPARHARLEGLEIFTELLPSAELGGDLCDYAPAGAGRVAVLIADVVGHGTSAAMLTGIVKSAFHAAHEDDYEPLSIVSRVSDGLAAFETGRFVTLLCARIAPHESRLEYVNAGHDGGLLLAPAGAARPLDSTGPLIAPGLPALAWKRAECEWAPDRALLLYTDGIPEATRDGEFYGVERLERVARASGTGASLLAAILADVADFTRGRPAADDQTLLHVRGARA